MMWHLLSQKPHRFLVFILLVFADARAFVALRLLMSNLLHVSISFVIGRAVVKQVLMFCADGLSQCLNPNLHSNPCQNLHFDSSNTSEEVLVSGS